MNHARSAKGTEKGITGSPKGGPVMHRAGPTGRCIAPAGLVRRLFLAVVMTLLLCSLLPKGVHAQWKKIEKKQYNAVAAKLQESLEEITKTNLLTTLSKNSYSAGRAKDKLQDLSNRFGTDFEDLDLQAIAIQIGTVVSDLVAPLFSQMDEIAKDFDAIVRNSRDSRTQDVAKECDVYPAKNGWIGNSTAFAYPEPAQRMGTRPSAEFCSFFPAVQTYLSNFKLMGDVPSVHYAEYATAKAEYMKFNFRNNEFQVAADKDARLEDWFVETAAFRSDWMIIVGMPLSLKTSVGPEKAVDLVITAVNTTLSLLAADCYFQMVVAGYSSPCFPINSLVLATEANKIKAIQFLRDQISRSITIGESTLPAATRLAWKLLQDSERAGITSNCSYTVIFISDGLLSKQDADETVATVAELQDDPRSPSAQAFAISLGPLKCNFCDAIVCSGGGVHINLPVVENASYTGDARSSYAGDASYYRSLVGAIIEMTAGFLDADKILTGKPKFDAETGDFELLLSNAVVFENEDGARELHGVVALSLDLNYVIDELFKFNITSSSLVSSKTSPYYTTLFFREERPGLVFCHPITDQMILGSNVFLPRSLTILEGEMVPDGGGAQKSGGKNVSNIYVSPFDVMLDSVPGCSVVLLDRRMLLHLRGSSVSVYESIFSGVSRVRSVLICWAPVAGTPWNAGVVMDASLTGTTKALEAHKEAGERADLPAVPVRASAMSFPTKEWKVPGELKDVYHRLELQPPLPQPTARPTLPGAWPDWFALHLAPRAFREAAKYFNIPHTEANVKALSAFMGLGPGGSRQLADNAGKVEVPELIGGGPLPYALRDLQIARQLASLWNISGGVFGAEVGNRWEDNVITTGIGMDSGVWYTWPARRILGKGTDVQDQLWFARAIETPGKLVVSREFPCSDGGEQARRPHTQVVCDGLDPLPPTRITLSICFRDIVRGLNASDLKEANEIKVVRSAPRMGVVMVSFSVSFFQRELFRNVRDTCYGNTICFLMDSWAYVIAHPYLPETPSEADIRKALERAKANTKGSPVSLPNAGVFVGDMHGAVADEMLHKGVLVRRTTKGATPAKNGMVYEVDLQVLANNGGVVEGTVAVGRREDFVIQALPSAELVLVIIRTSGRRVGEEMVQTRIDYCGTFSPSCPRLMSPWQADLAENQTLEELVKECNGKDTAAPQRGLRKCPICQERIGKELKLRPGCVPSKRALEILWNVKRSSDDESSANQKLAVAKQLHGLRVLSAQTVCATALEEATNSIIILVILGVGLLGVAVALCVQAGKAKAAHLEEVRKFRDELHQPVKEISDCARLIRNECHAVISAARSFQDFAYFIDSLERKAVELLVNQTRCQLRHHNLVLQALKDLVRALSHDMYNLHSRTARLEAAAAEFEEAEQQFPQYQARKDKLRKTLEQLVLRDEEESEYTHTNTVSFYANHHPDIFGSDLTDNDTSAVNTPRSTVMGGMLADDTSAMLSARGNTSRHTSNRMLVLKEMPVHPPHRSERSERHESWRGRNRLAHTGGAGASRRGDGDDGWEAGGSVGGAGAVAAPVSTPRLGKTAAGPTEHRVEHFMKLAAARARDRLVPRLTLSSARPYKGLPPLAEGMDATDLDYTDDDYTLLETGWHGVKRGPTVSERARVLSKLDTHGHVADMYTEAADLTESRWDDTGYDVTAYDVLTDFNEPNDTAGAGGVIEEGDETEASKKGDSDDENEPSDDEHEAPSDDQPQHHQSQHHQPSHHQPSHHHNQGAHDENEAASCLPLRLRSPEDAPRVEVNGMSVDAGAVNACTRQTRHPSQHRGSSSGSQDSGQSVQGQEEESEMDEEEEEVEEDRASVEEEEEEQEEEDGEEEDEEEEDGEEVSEGGRKSELYSVEEEHGDAATREEEQAHLTHAPHHQEHQN